MANGPTNGLKSTALSVNQGDFIFEKQYKKIFFVVIIFFGKIIFAIICSQGLGLTFERLYNGDICRGKEHSDDSVTNKRNDNELNDTNQLYQ
jgi:hypothetical protein